MKKNYIFIRENNKSYFFKYINDANIENYYILKPKSLLFKLLAKTKINRDFFCGKWKKNVKNYDLFILGENHYNIRFTNYIRKHNPNCRIIVFFWNCVGDLYKKIFDDPNVNEFWTFDKNDAKKYNMKFNTQLYSKNVKLPKKKIINDIIFCGRPKGRDDILDSLKNEFDKNNIKNKMNIIKKEKDFIPYDKYLEMVSESKAILDIVSGHQIGLSLRCMESIFFEKKLITNNVDIVNYDFYDSNNIFIIGKDNINNLQTFLNTEYKKIDPEIVNYYDYDNWLNRFYN